MLNARRSLTSASAAPFPLLVPASSTLVSTIVIACAVILWLSSLPMVDPHAITDVGLVSVLPPHFFIALALLTASFCYLVYHQTAPRALLLAHVVVLIVIVHGTTALVYGTPRYAWTYKHIGVTEFIQRTGAVNPTIDIYNNWPGFFALAAFFSEMSGLGSALYFAAWAQVFHNLLYLGALLFVFRACTADRRLVWMSTWIFFLCSWTGQDYFSPQALAYFFHLLILGICLAWYRTTHPPSPEGIKRWLRSDRLTALYCWITGFRSIEYSGFLSSRAQRAGLTIILVLTYAVVVATHQLTPFMTLVAVTALVLAHRLNTRSLPVLMMVMVVTWILYMGREFLDARGYWLFDTLGNFHFQFAERVSLETAVSPGVATVGFAVRTLILTFWILAVVGGIRRVRHGYWDLAVAALFLTPFPMRALQSYGGEMILRIYFFSLPWAAFFAASVFYPSPWSGRSWKTWAASTIASISLVVLFTVSYYGQERMNYIPPDEIEAFDYLYSTAAPQSAIYAPISNTLGNLKNYENFQHYWFFEWDQFNKTPFDSAQFARLIRYMTANSRPEVYLLLSRSQREFINLRGVAPLDSMPRLEAAAGQSPALELVWSSPSAMIFRLIRPDS